MIRIKLTVVVLIMLAAFSCKKEPHNKEASPNAIEPPNSYKKVEANEDIEIFAEMAKDCDQTFDDFFKRFAKDSVFQKSRAKYPFKYVNRFHDYDTQKDTFEISLIPKKEFMFFDFSKDKTAINNLYDKYTIDIEYYDSIVNYKWLGYDNGIRVTHIFKLIDNCWYLVEILDESM